MRKMIFCCLLFIGPGLLLHAQDRQAILKVMETSRLAWNKGDLDTFMQCYWRSDSVMFVSSTGPTFGYQNTLSAYKKTYAGKAGLGTLTYAIKKVQLFDKENAFVYGGWFLKYPKTSSSGYYTLLFKKINGKWVIVADHSS